MGVINITFEIIRRYIYDLIYDFQTEYSVKMVPAFNKSTEIILSLSIYTRVANVFWSYNLK